MKKMYNNINVERVRHNMTIQAFAKAIGINPRTYYAWQKRGNIPATKLIAMSKLFNCSIDYLLSLK